MWYKLTLILLGENNFTLILVLLASEPPVARERSLFVGFGLILGGAQASSNKNDRMIIIFIFPRIFQVGL